MLGYSCFTPEQVSVTSAFPGNAAHSCFASYPASKNRLGSYGYKSHLYKKRASLFVSLRSCTNAHDTSSEHESDIFDLITKDPVEADSLIKKQRVRILQLLLILGEADEPMRDLDLYQEARNCGACQNSDDFNALFRLMTQEKLVKRYPSDVEMVVMNEDRTERVLMVSLLQRGFQLLGRDTYGDNLFMGKFINDEIRQFLRHDFREIEQVKNQRALRRIQFDDRGRVIENGTGMKGVKKINNSVMDDPRFKSF